MTTTYQEIHLVPELWDRLVPLLDEIDFVDTWGVTWDRQADFTYVAGCEAIDASSRLDSMVTHEIAAHRCAVFTHRGKLNTLGSTV